MSAPAYPFDVIRNRKPAWETPGIDARDVTAKLKAIRELRYPEAAEQLDACPQLAHMLWFIQDRSHQPGGLDKFACDLLLESPARLRNQAMAEIKWPRSGRYTVEQCVRIWREMHGDLSGVVLDTGPDELVDDDDWGERRKSRQLQERQRELWSQVGRIIEIAEGAGAKMAKSKADKLREEIAPLLTADLSVLRKLDTAENHAAAFLVMTLTPEVFWTHCAKTTLSELPADLVRLATSAEHEFGPCGKGADRLKPHTWHSGERDTFDGLVPALIEYMESFATKGRRNVAATSISNQITDKFSFALEMKANVLIVGDSRFGKSVTLENDCRRQPGRCRLVTLRANMPERDLIDAHAEALHLKFDPKLGRLEFEHAVRSATGHSGLLFGYDEIHFAFPTEGSRRTPRLLDWIRTNVVDRRLGVVFCATRQGYTKALSDFVKRSRFAIEQWAGRIDAILQIGQDAEDQNAAPALTHADLMLIARHKAPDHEDDLLEDIAVVALRYPTPANVVHSLLRLSEWNAKKARRKTPVAADVAAAIEEWKSQPQHSDFENAAGPPPVQRANGRCSAEAPPATGSSPAVPLRDAAASPRNRLSTLKPEALATG